MNVKKNIIVNFIIQKLKSKHAFVTCLPDDCPDEIFSSPENVNARKNVQCLIFLAKFIETVTTKVGVRRKLNCVFAKILTNVFMVLYAKTIRIVAKKAGVILHLDAFVKNNEICVEIYAYCPFINYWVYCKCFDSRFYSFLL